MRKLIGMLIFVFLTLGNQLLIAQIKGVVVDKETRQPIPYASIYTKNGETVLGAMSNDKGQFTINFPFQALFFSHINYEKMEIQKENLLDSVCLKPVSVALNELVVSPKQPKWISRILIDVVKQKSKNYQNSEKLFAYSYESFTLGDSTGYGFKSRGNLLMPKLSNNPQYYIHAQNNIIKYKNKTAGVDFTNLKRMLYGDFIGYFDMKFIKNNEFRQITDIDSKNLHLIQLYFRDKKDENTNGFMIIDTLKCAITEVEHNVGTQYNNKNNSTLYFKTFAPKLGITHTIWITKSRYKYNETEAGYSIAESNYKFIRKSTQKSKIANSQYFTTIESKLSLQHQQIESDKSLIPLIKPFDAITIYTKRMQNEENELNRVPVSFEKL